MTVCVCVGGRVLAHNCIMNFFYTLCIAFALMHLFLENIDG